MASRLASWLLVGSLLLSAKVFARASRDFTLKVENSSRYLRAPLTFVHDLRYTAKPATQLSAELGVPVSFIRDVLNDKDVYGPTLDTALMAFYSDDKVSLQSQMSNVMRKGNIHRVVMLPLLRIARRIVEQFGGRMNIPKSMRTYCVFDPDATMLRLVRVVESCRALLTRIKFECPEAYEEINKWYHPKSKRKASNGTNRVHKKKRRTIHKNTKGCRKGRPEISPSVYARAGLGQHSGTDLWDSSGSDVASGG